MYTIQAATHAPSISVKAEPTRFVGAARLSLYWRLLLVAVFQNHFLIAALGCCFYLFDIVVK
jgi:hypothetical protein